MTNHDIRAMLAKPINKIEYRKIRRLWIEHSKAEDARDIAGLMATLTKDCVYTYPQTGHRWEGHAGATAFYTEMLTAIPDIHFDLHNIVIGPQGVWEEAKVTGTQTGVWLGYPPNNEPFEMWVNIYFPWDAEKELFTGERMYLVRIGDGFVQNVKQN
jgi:predicted ester cyclase